jgi:hypothetical protein
MPNGKKNSKIFIERMAFRCSEAMFAAVQQAAGREKLNPTDYVRRAVARQLRADGIEPARKGVSSQHDHAST